MSLGMGKENTRRWWTMLIVWLIILLIAFLALGCSTEEYWSSENRFSWSTSIQTLDDSNDPWLERDVEEPVKCRNGETYYRDPYTKLEYCLPDDLTKIVNLNVYRMEK